jgi:hypothetical protein
MKQSVTVLFACLAPWVAHAASMQFVRYTNDQGVVVIGNSIPADAARRGYEIIDEHGKVLKVVTRELTPAELEAKRAADEAAKRAEEERLERERRDHALLELYASVSDVEDARDRKLKALDVEIGRIKAQVEQATIQKSKLESQAADQERAGRAPSADLLDNITRLGKRIEGQMRDIDAREAEKAEERSTFAYDIQRMACLLGEATVEACREPETAVADSGALTQVDGTNTPAASNGH